METQTSMKVATFDRVTTADYAIDDEKGYVQVFEKALNLLSLLKFEQLEGFSLPLNVTPEEAKEMVGKAIENVTKQITSKIPAPPAASQVTANATS
jgi:hypothetical protein